MTPVRSEAQVGACQVGARVIDRQDRTGTVTEANGSDCRVKLDSGESRFYLAWMLSAASSQKAGAAGSSSTSKSAAPAKTTASATNSGKGLTAGNYECWAAGGVAGTMRLAIRNATTYASSEGTTGKYTFDPATGKFTFDTGPWAGYFGRKFDDKQFGVSSREGNYYGTTCNLK
jgi:hypothetical protein